MEEQYESQGQGCKEGYWNGYCQGHMRDGVKVKVWGYMYENCEEYFYLNNTYII